MTEEEAIERIRIVTNGNEFRVYDVAESPPKMLSTHASRKEAMAAWTSECLRLMTPRGST